MWLSVSLVCLSLMTGANGVHHARIKYAELLGFRETRQERMTELGDE
ncbi:MAG: hypothetical protein KGL39_57985 [Patescibacteria group bacterium]|nr:hypothetical protein [Patescibacteria group bacterium]